MNESLARLQPYPFDKLARLRVATRPAGSKSVIELSIGEPRYETPRFIIDGLTRHIPKMARYPGARGLDGLRKAIARWLLNRFYLSPKRPLPEAHVLPGTREALFAIAQCAVDRSRPEGDAESFLPELRRQLAGT